MKKMHFLGFLSILIPCVVGCSGGNETTDSTSQGDSSTKKDTNIKDSDSLNFVVNSIYDSGEVLDQNNGLSSVNDVTKVKAFVNGEYQSSITSISTRQDAKIEIYTQDKMRFLNVSGGYIFTLPSVDTIVDNEIGKYRTQFSFEDSILSVSSEASNPYTSEAHPWYTYANEWLMLHLLNESYISKNDLTRTVECNYNFTEQNGYGNTTFKDGYDVYFFGIQINNTNNQIERPFYNIAVVREVNDVKNFTLFVMKSKADKASVMESIVTSYKKVKAKGIQRNYFYSEQATEESHWNDETKAYYESLLNKKYVNWGVFSYSMPGGANELTAGSSVYDSYLSNSQTIQDNIETKWNHSYEIYPTYTHLSYASDMHYFPVEMANALAGGNGTNGKPVLQFTYQFTTDNNNVGSQFNPSFDILRGKYDDHFRKLAQDMKSYGKPILFRLNNEMNTDWTSYSGIMSLLDPDIFVMTWRRLYDICIEEGCDNLIWIWNPIATSCPYSSWGEDLCYFPGLKYVQLLGGTSYEFNNYDAKEAASSIKSFQTLYNTLFKKNCAAFSTNWKMILSEFACGSGGETTGQLGRNAAVQAEWVKLMFEELNSSSPAQYVEQIRGAVWFNANDYVGSKIMNRLQLVNRPGNTRENYDDLAQTMEEFRVGFANQDAKA